MFGLNCRLSFTREPFKMHLLTGTFVLVLAVLVGQSSATSCRTCRGSLCSEDNVPFLDCNRQILDLPFENSNLVRNDDIEDAEYGCLDLEYIENQNSNIYQQCILTNNPDGFCDELKATFSKIIRCNVMPITESRRKRAVLDEGSTTSNPTVTTSTSSEENTTPKEAGTTETNSSEAASTTTTENNSSEAASITTTENNSSEAASITTENNSSETTTVESTAVTDDPNNSGCIYGISILLFITTLSVIFL